MAEYGYIRVSTAEQREDRQRLAMWEVGVPASNIYCDKKSGKDFERTAYKRLVTRLKKGDVLYVKSIDRFGRNYDQIIWQWRFLTRKKEVDIVVLDMPLLDTRQKKDLMGQVISDIVLELLGYVAHAERDFIRKRQAEGISAAKARGVHFGRKGKPLPPCFDAVCAEWRSGAITISTAAEKLGMPRSSFAYRAGKKGVSQ